MAKLGTVFVELLLDDKVYKKNLSEQLTSTTATAKGIEQSWKVLGQRSDDVFNAQRRSYENALTLIKNSHNATKQDIIRAEQAAADKIRRINEQQYGHQTTMIEGLKKNWLGMTAAVAAVAMAANKALQLMEEGAKAMQQKSSFKMVAEEYGANAEKMISSMKAATKQTVDDSELMQKATKLMLAGYNPEQIERFSKGVIAASQYMGSTVEDVYDRISDALASRMPKAMVQAGAVTKDQMEIVQTALKNGATQSELLELAIANLTVKTLILQGTEDEAALSMQRFSAQAKDTKEAVGIGLVWAAQKAYGVLQWLAAGALNVAGGIAWVAQKIAEFDAWVASKTSPSEKYIAERKKYAEEMAATTRSIFDAAGDLASKGADNITGRGEPTGSKASKTEINAAKDSVNAIMAKIAAYKDATKAVNDHHKAVKDQHKTEVEQLRAETGIIYNIEDSYRATEKAIEDMTEAAQEGFELTMDSIKKIEFDELKKNLKSISDSFGDLGNACMDLSSIYEEGSKSARMWEEAAKAFEVAQKAVAVANAVATIANQGLGDPYTAFARIAAMAATMASLLATIGESVGGGGGSSSSVTAKYTSTALGSNEASQSASKSYELLKDSYSMQYERLTKIYGEMKDLNSSITGLVTSIVSTGGFSTAGMHIKTGSQGTLLDKFTDKYNLIRQDMGVLTTIGNFFNAPLMGLRSITDKIFGGSTETKIKETGLSVGASSLADILSGGVSAQQYAKIKTTTDGGWFGSDKTSYSYKYQDLDSGVSQMLNLVFQSLGSSIVSLSEAFGVDTKNALDYVFKETKLNLKGMTSEEMNTAISEYISTTADNAAQALFGNLLGKYQQLNEGLMETATRVLRNKEIIEDYVTKTNKAFTGTTDQIIGFTESLVDLGGTLDDLTDNIQTYINAFYSDAERQAMLAQDLMDAMGGNMPGSRSGFRAMVEGLDLTTEAGQRGYVTMMKLAGEADKYYSFIEEAAEKAAEDAKRQRLEQITSEFEFRKAALTDLYNQQLQAAQDRLSAITEIANKLTAARERMKVQDAIIEAANFRGAKSNLMRGIWNDDSLNTLTGINPGQYSSRQDYLRDYYDIYNQLSALEQDALSKKSAAERTIDWLKSQYEIDLQNLDLQRQQAESLVVIKQVCTRTNKGLQEFDDGGIASGPSSGYEARLHGTELVISPRKGYSATVKSNNEDVVNSINELKNEVRGILVSMNNTTQKSYDIIDNWDRIGLPVEQT